MSRHRFELWGIDLDERSFAEALAGAGAGEVRNGIAEWRMGAIPPPMTIEDARARWNALGVSRIEVQSPGNLDIAWLNATLARIAQAVYFRDDDPDVAVAWEWPLRIGLLEDDRADELRKSLDNTVLAKLVRFVSMGGQARECELLLIPCNLRAAVERVLAVPGRLTADCVIVMGGAKVESERLALLTRTLRTDARTAGVAVASVPKEHRAQWLSALVANLSHNTTIDAALRQAGNTVGADAPLLVCSRRLAELARLSRYVERLGTRMKRSSRPAAPVSIDPHTAAYLGVNEGDSLETMGKELERKAEGFRYGAERDEATAIVELRECVEAATAEPLAVPRMSMRMAEASPAPAPAPAEELAMPAPEPSKPGARASERYVRADFYDQRESQPVPLIESRHAYFLRIRIAPPGGTGAIANVSLDESQLPISETGHELTIALFELADDGHSPASPPAQVKVHLPGNRAASSTPAWFPVITPAKGTFVARVIVLHQTRVLQTLLLRAPVDAPQSEVDIRQESVVLPSFEIAGSRRPFDAAVVVNESGGTPAVMAMTETSVAYDEPVDIKLAIEAIAAAVNQLTKLADHSDITIDDQDVVDVLITLANQGKILSKWISRKLPPEIAGADRVQIVDVRQPLAECRCEPRDRRRSVPEVGAQRVGVGVLSVAGDCLCKGPVPGQPELAMGAVASGGAIVVNENILAPRAGAAEVRAEMARQLAELRRRESLYRNDRLPLDVAGRIVILVDDGAATGASMLAAIRAMRKLHAQRVVVALPVASEDALLALRSEANEVICVLTPAIFRSVGDWYQDFTQTTDAQVVSLLASARTGDDRKAASLRSTSEPLRE